MVQKRFLQEQARFKENEEKSSYFQTETFHTPLQMIYVEKNQIAWR